MNGTQVVFIYIHVKDESIRISAEATLWDTAMLSIFNSSHVHALVSIESTVVRGAKACRPSRSAGW